MKSNVGYFGSTIDNISQYSSRRNLNLVQKNKKNKQNNPIDGTSFKMQTIKECVLEDNVAFENINKYDLNKFGIDRLDNLIENSQILTSLQNEMNEEKSTGSDNSIDDVLLLGNAPRYWDDCKKNEALTTDLLITSSLEISKLTEDNINIIQECIGVVCLKAENFVYVYFYEFLDEMEIDLQKFNVNLGDWLKVIIST